MTSRTPCLDILAALAVLAIFASCKPGDAGRDAAVRAPKVLSVAIWEPETIDPGLAGEESGITIAAALFEGLVRRPAGEGPARPGVASSWESSADRLTWTFHLRPDARWSDGRPVTAGDFDYAWRRVLDPASGARLVAQLYVIDGAEEVHAGRAPALRLGVRALDATTLEVRLRVPTVDFPGRLAHPVFAPVRADVIAREGARWTRPGSLIGNGAFRLDAFQPGDRAVLTRNPSGRSTALDGVTFHFLSGERLAYEWFAAGKVHWLKGTLSRDRIPEMRKTRPAEFHSDPVLCTGYVALRVDRPPLDDPRVRRALDMSVDKERLVREVLMGGQPPARSFVPPEIATPTGYVPPAGSGFDPVHARTLLDEARRAHGALAPLSYVYNSGEANKVIAEFLQAQWKENLGLDVSLEATEWKSLLARVRKGDYGMARASWCADVVDPLNFLEILRTGAPSNYPGFSDPEVDRRLEAARVEGGPEARNALLQLAETRMLDAAPMIPLYHFTRIYLLSPRVRGFQKNLLDVHPLEDLDLADAPAAD